MKATKTITATTTTTKLDYLQCELCGKRTGHERNWSGDAWRIDEVLIRYEHGYRYPESYSTETDIVDLCPECFTSRLIPWLKSQGANPRTEETDD